MRMHCVQSFTIPISHALFDDLPAEERALVADSFRLERRELGERFGEDVETSSLVLVVTGRVRVFLAGPDDRELTLALLDEGEAFGAAPIEGARPRRIEALASATVLTCTEEDLARLVEQAPSFGIRVVGLLLESARTVGDELARLAFCAVPARLAAKLLELMERYGRVTPAGIRIDVRFTHMQLSAMIGTSRETLTKALGELRASGAIDVRDRLIWVMDAAALEQACVIS
jgi:CRP/FNR family transcriptional regulator, cyclic AMP receptor protein